jgi:hypothetical protein
MASKTARRRFSCSRGSVSRLTLVIDILDEWGQGMNTEEMDGFFWALIAGPKTVTPNEYLPEVFGGDPNEMRSVDTIEEGEWMFSLCSPVGEGVHGPPAGAPEGCSPTASSEHCRGGREISERTGLSKQGCGIGGGPRRPDDQYADGIRSRVGSIRNTISWDFKRCGDLVRTARGANR